MTKELRATALGTSCTADGVIQVSGKVTSGIVSAVGRRVSIELDASLISGLLDYAVRHHPEDLAKYLREHHSLRNWRRTHPSDELLIAIADLIHKPE